MCGIVGLFDLEGNSAAGALIGRMANVIRHRGPDDEGYLLTSVREGKIEPRSGIDTVPELAPVIKPLDLPADFRADLALGHRRLSIIDVSPAGHQPMSNEDGTVWIVYNGEIYNFQPIKEELKKIGHSFRSYTDTEVIIHAYEQWGTQCLERFNGMWSFAIWDLRRKKLFCSRDRFGVKPFYYYFDGKRFVFASEIKAILEADFVPRTPNETNVRDFLAGGAVDHLDETFFQGIKPLRGGHYLELDPLNSSLEIERFYDIPLGNIVKRTEAEYAARFRELFEDSVRLRLMSDVPVGSCLSGGLDSSSIVCVIDRLMRDKGVKVQGGRGMQRTFSARYNDRRHDEGSYIDDVVKQSTVEASYTYPTGTGLREALPRLVWHQEEPFGTTSIYAQWEVFKLMRRSGVKVALDGQGADEVLAGYHGYFGILFYYLTQTHQYRQLTAESLDYARIHRWPACRALATMGFNWALRTAYLHLHPRGRKLAASAGEGPLKPDKAKQRLAGYFDWYLYYTVMTSSIPSLLRFEDKNSMAHSVESRVPFLDYRLVEFCFTLPWSQKIRHGTTKYIQRQAMEGILPESIAHRQDKIGFSTPEDAWFRSELKDDFRRIIDSESFRSRSFFKGVRVQEAWESHQAKKRNNSNQIWRWVNLEMWLRQFIDTQGKREP